MCHIDSVGSMQILFPTDRLQCSSVARFHEDDFFKRQASLVQHHLILSALNFVSTKGLSLPRTACVSILDTIAVMQNGGVGDSSPAKRIARLFSVGSL